MSEFLFYLVKCSICLILFYAFYSILLKKDTNYRWNRGFLLFGGLCSLILPLANIAYPFSNAGSDNISLSYYLNPIVLNSNSGVSASDYDYISIIFYGYLIIGAALLLKFFAGLFNLTLLITKSKIVSKEGKKYYLIEKEVSPFSFFKMIFLPNDEIDNSLLDRIIKHEQIHAKKNHSVDVLFFELIKIILWFNPFAWLYRKEVEAQNEFAADDEMLQNGYDISEYKHEIFDFSLLQSNSLTNNFNSLLKRRLKMLTSKKSSGLSKSKFLLTIPLLFLLIFAFNNPNNAKNIITGKSADSVYTTADQMPEYPGGQSQMYNFILKNLGYPMIAKKAGIQGKVFVEFVVNKNGKIQNAKVKTGIGGGCDEEALRVVKAMPKWIPGKHNGKNVAVKITLPIMFKLQ